jgi:hypothetical protein
LNLKAPPDPRGPHTGADQRVSLGYSGAGLISGLHRNGQNRG